jgi:hypothetical protein
LSEQRSHRRKLLFIPHIIQKALPEALLSQPPYRCNNKEKTSMYLVMGITGNVGGATARHLLKQGKQVRALVRNREKAAEWADQGVDLVDGGWNDATVVAAALKGVEGAFVMLPAVWGTLA